MCIYVGVGVGWGGGVIRITCYERIFMKLAMNVHHQNISLAYSGECMQRPEEYCEILSS